MTTLGRGATLTHLLSVYGYWVVLVVVGLESSGIPFPGETMLLAAALYGLLLSPPPPSRGPLVALPRLPTATLKPTDPLAS